MATTPWTAGVSGSSKKAFTNSRGTAGNVSFGGNSGFSGGGRGGSFPVSNAGTSAPAAPNIPTQPYSAPAPLTPKSSGGGGGSAARSAGGGSTSYSAVAPTDTGVMAAQAAPQAQTFEEWKAAGGHAGDSIWSAESASANSEYENLLASLAQQNTGFLNDWRGGLNSMGWKFGGEGDRSGGWNSEDLLGAYGQTRNNMVNDYAGRGLLDSTFYQDATSNMDRRFNQQRDDMLRTYDNTNNEYGTNKANALKSKESAQQRALADAYSRYASGLGL